MSTALERCVVRMDEQGVQTVEIARRLRRAPETIVRLREMAGFHPADAVRLPQGDVLRPLERRILRWRAAGAAHLDIGPKFRRSADFVRRVEALAEYKLRRGAPA